MRRVKMGNPTLKRAMRGCVTESFCFDLVFTAIQSPTHSLTLKRVPIFCRQRRGFKTSNRRKILRDNRDNPLSVCLMKYYLSLIRRYYFRPFRASPSSSFSGSYMPDPAVSRFSLFLWRF